MEALVDAAQAGKDVTAIIELRARFDEAANIQLATRLQEAGAHVVYGVVGYKTHAKLIIGRAAGGRAAQALLPRGHRQLSPENRARLYGLRAVHLR